MKTLAALAFSTLLPQLLLGQGPVLIGGGSTHPQAVMGGHSSPRVVVTKVIFRQEVNPLNPYAAASLNCGPETPHISQVAVASYSPADPLCASTYRICPPRHTARSVIYFGRGESCQRGYAFSRPR
jgi:hypothetical protein